MSDSPGVVSKRIHFTESEKFSTKLCEWGVLYANHKVTMLPRFLLPQKFSTQRRYWAWNIKNFIKSINSIYVDHILIYQRAHNIITKFITATLQWSYGEVSANITMAFLPNNVKLFLIFSCGANFTFIFNIMNVQMYWL